MMIYILKLPYVGVGARGIMVKDSLTASPVLLPERARRSYGLVARLGERIQNDISQPH
jgi:hypothetical protein